MKTFHSAAAVLLLCCTALANGARAHDETAFGIVSAARDLGMI